MSIGSVPKSCGCIILSASVISATDCMRNANKCPKIPYSAMVKIIKSDPHADPDHHQKLITSRGSPLAHACQVWLTFVSALITISYPVSEWQNEWQNNHITHALLTEVIKILYHLWLKYSTSSLDNTPKISSSHFTMSFHIKRKEMWKKWVYYFTTNLQLLRLHHQFHYAATLLLLVCVSFTIIVQPRNSVLIRRV